MHTFMQENSWGTFYGIEVTSTGAVCYNTIQLL